VIAGDGAASTNAERLTAAVGSTADASGLRTGLAAAIGVATLLTALALALALLVGQSARARLLPLLATLGLGRRGERAIVAWEIAPVTAVAVVAGVLLGATVPLVVLPGVDLRSFTGGSAPPAVTYDWGLVAAVVAASVIVSAAAAAAAAHIGGRVSAARAMRKEEEG
jgi:putative ABC transport system permease protein